jgi:hypothetical protein
LDILAAFADSCTDDLMVHISFDQPPSFADSCFVPSLSLQNEILLEAQSIIYNYAPLIAHDFSSVHELLIPEPHYLHQDGSTFITPKQF